MLGKHTFRHVARSQFDIFESHMNAIDLPADMKILARNPQRFTHVIENPSPTAKMLARTLGTRVEPYGEEEVEEPEVAAELEVSEPEILEEEPTESDV